MEDYKEALRFIDRNCTVLENQKEFIEAKHTLDRYIDEYENVLRDYYIVTRALDELCRLYKDLNNTAIAQSQKHYENKKLNSAELRIKYLKKALKEMEN